MRKSLTILAVVVGIACVGMAVYYWTTPANMLSSFVPGYDPTLAAPHVKHGIAALVVGIALFIYAWFASGKKK